MNNDRKQRILAQAETLLEALQLTRQLIACGLCEQCAITAAAHLILVERAVPKEHGAEAMSEINFTHRRCAARFIETLDRARCALA